MHMCGNSKTFPLATTDVVDIMYPWTKLAFELFGEDRVMFESNFPMDKASYSYTAYWNAAKIIVAMLSADPSVRRKLLFDNANRTYALGLDTPDGALYEYRIPSAL